MRALHAPLRRALRAYRAFEQVRRYADAGEQTLELIAIPVFVLSCEAQIEHVNGAAEALLGRPGAARVDGRRLLSLGDVGAPQLLTAIHAAAVGQARDLCVGIESAGHLEVGLLRLVQLPRHHSIRVTWPRAEVLLQVEVRDTQVLLRARIDSLSRRYGLTEAEANVAKLLCGGANAEELAARLGVRVSTVRTHIRNLFEKSETSRQADLILLFLGT